MKSKRKETIEQITKNLKDTQNERRTVSTELRKSGPMTITELERATGLRAKRILRHLIAMRKVGEVTEIGEKDGGYVYVLRKGK